MTAARAFDTSLTMDARPEQVWTALVDVAAWPTWDSGVTDVDGRLALGAKLTIRVAANPGRAFPVKVAEIDAPRRLVFRGGMPMGLFTGERTYTLEPDGTGTRFTMREVYTGPMAGLIFRSIPDLTASFQQFATGLSQQAASVG
jgi:uncharacterized protein YndB with AHSA1/START domain